MKPKFSKVEKAYIHTIPSKHVNVQDPPWWKSDEVYNKFRKWLLEFIRNEITEQWD